MPVNLLSILAGAGIAIAYGTYVPIHELLTVAFLGAAVAVMIRAAPEGTTLTDPIDEREAERILTISAYAGALAVGAVALLVAFLWPSLALVVIGITALWVVAWWPRGVRTNTLTSQIAIRRDPATVFAFVSDFENEPKYWAMVEQVEKLTPGPIGAGRPGSNLDVLRRLPGILRWFCSPP